MRHERWFVVFVAAFMAALAVESLLLFMTHSSALERMLQDDFRVLFFLKKDLPDVELKVLEDKLLALPYVREASHVSRDAALAAVREEDPELVDSITWMGDNPLLGAYEVRLTPAGLENLASWLTEARQSADWAQVRYQAGQLRAILQARFYSHFSGVILGILLWGSVLGVLLFLWGLYHRAGAWDAGNLFADLRPLFLKSAQGALCSFLGAALGMGMALLILWPAHSYLPWWSVPLFSFQFLTWMAISVFGGLLSLWMSAE